MNIRSVRTMKLLGLIITLFGFGSVALQAEILVQARASATVIQLGQSVELYADGYDGTGSLARLTGWIRGPGDYVPETAWAGWTLLLWEDFAPRISNSRSVTFTPTAAGTYQFHANAYDTNSAYAGTDVSNWVSWDTYSSGPVIAATITVLPPTPAPHAEVQGRASSQTITLGQSITLYTDARMSDGVTPAITQLTGWVRGPGDYVPETAWAGWTQVINSNFGACAANSASYTFTPTEAGTYQFHGNAETGGVSVCPDVTNWVSWNTYTHGAVVAATFTVLPPAPANTPPTVWILPTGNVIPGVGGRWVELGSEATDVDGNLSTHFIGPSTNPGSAWTSTGATGGSSFKTVIVFVPTFTAQLWWAVTTDLSGASRTASILVR